MRVHDLNSRAHLSLGGAIFFLPSRPRWSCVRRTIRICATHGVSAAARIQRLRQPLQRQWPIAWFFVSRSILVPELRAIDVSRKSAGYRNVPASARAEVASRGFSRQSVAQHVGRCKPRSRLANLCRLRPSVDSSCSPVVRARAAGGRSQAGGRRARRMVDKTTGLRSDQTIVLAGLKSSRLYPDPLRRIAFYDVEHRRRLVFLTNNFTLPALTVARLYKCRWQVELFFKWIKQHLRIKAFYGTHDNAVKTQIWIAISVYVLVAIVKKELRTKRSLYEILQILSITLFEKTPLFQALLHQNQPLSEPTSPKQLTLFDL